MRERVQMNWTGEEEKNIERKTAKSKRIRKVFKQSPKWNIKW